MIYFVIKEVMSDSFCFFLYYNGKILKKFRIFQSFSWIKGGVKF